MKYALFIFLQTISPYSNTPYIHSQEFFSKKACEEAIPAIELKMRKIWLADRNPKNSDPQMAWGGIEFECVSLGSPND